MDRAQAEARHLLRFYPDFVALKLLRGGFFSEGGFFREGELNLLLNQILETSPSRVFFSEGDFFRVTPFEALNSFRGDKMTAGMLLIGVINSESGSGSRSGSRSGFLSGSRSGSRSGFLSGFLSGSRSGSWSGSRSGSRSYSWSW